MKKLILSFAICLALNVSAQVSIEGTYLPVRNTALEQVWDTVATNMPIPTTGANQVWDYSSAFTNIVDTFYIETLDPSSTAYAANFPDATHSTYVRSPFALVDSLWVYFKYDTIGVHNVGYYSEKSDIQGYFYTNPNEFVTTQDINMSTFFQDTAYTEGNFLYQGTIPAIYTRHIYKTMQAAGYGTLLTPDGTYTDVLLATEQIYQYDSVFADPFGSGNYQLVQTNPNDFMRYHFLRNNTFATTHLMQLNADAAETTMKFGWYTLPVDFGSISGTVYDTTGTPVTSGEMILYREYSNFTKNDILATTDVAANGTYQFDSIPYGEYRIAVRPDTSIYTNSLTTYHGDTTNWIDCAPIVTTGPTSVSNDITISYHAPSNSQAQATGNVYQNLGYTRANDPIPGIDVIIRKNPSGEVANGAISEGAGSFNLTDLPDGDYDVFVDIPGLHMHGTYNFTIQGGSSVSSLDFIVSLDSIYPVSQVQTIAEVTSELIDVKAFPNPFASNTTVAFKLKESSDVTIEVFNLIGEKTAEVFTGDLPKGNFSFDLGEEDFGASGLYIVRIIADGTPTTLRLVKE